MFIWSSARPVLWSGEKTMDRIGRAFALGIISSSLLIAACGGGQPASNQNENASASQPATPLIVPKNQSKPGMGSIKVGTRPAGAAITLIAEAPGGGAGMPERRGTTPATIIDLAPGKYTVHLELRPYKAFQKSVEVKPDETTTVTAELTK
jgi:PEGA domain